MALISYTSTNVDSHKASLAKYVKMFDNVILSLCSQYKYMKYYPMDATVGVLGFYSQKIKRFDMYSSHWVFKYIILTAGAVLKCIVNIDKLCV